jgi:hypothetical protein
MSTQPTALRLAGALDAHQFDEPHAAAAELRRLHAENEAFGIHLSERMKDLAEVEAQRDALLEALKELLDADNYYPWCGLSASELAAIDKARAAIKQAEENT